MSLFKRTWNTGNLLVLIGFLALLTTFVWPYVTANRVARVESWAESIAGQLLNAAIEDPELDLEATGAAERLLGTLEDSHERNRLRPRPPEDSSAAAGAYFEGKHYAYAILRPPVDPNADPLRPVEVYAWPLSNLGPGRTAFFFSEDATAAYTHNLHTRYRGWERVPQPGSGRAPDPEDLLSGAYRARDGERWMALDRE